MGESGTIPTYDRDATSELELLGIVYPEAVWMSNNVYARIKIIGSVGIV